MVNKTAPKRTGVSVPVPVLVAGVIVIVGMVGFIFLQRQANRPIPSPVITPEAKQYVSHLKLSDVSMQAHESYLKQSVVEITGKIQNTGSRGLQYVEITCVFYDPYGQVVLREHVPIVSSRAGGLEPGATKPFRLAFDNIPDSWNQMLPQLVIAQINFM